MTDPMGNIAAILTDRVRRMARRKMVSGLFIGLALLFAGVAIVAGITAIGVVLASHWGVLAGCLIIAGASLSVALTMVIVAAQRAKKARRQQMVDRAQLQQTVLAARALASDVTASKALLIAAAALGVLAGLTGGPRHPPGASGPP